MRDAIRDAESALAYAERDNQELIDRARDVNYELIAKAAELAAIWDEGDMLMQTQELARELQAIRYELTRRRVPNPSGANAQVNITSSMVTGTNAGEMSNTTTGSVTDSAGVAIGNNATGSA